MIDPKLKNPAALDILLKNLCEGRLVSIYGTFAVERSRVADDHVVPVLSYEGILEMSYNAKDKLVIAEAYGGKTFSFSAEAPMMPERSNNDIRVSLPLLRYVNGSFNPQPHWIRITPKLVNE